MDEEKDEGLLPTPPDDRHDTLADALEEIGVGRYSWELFVVCGMGWLADNAWIQAVVLSTPQLQDEFGLSDTQGGFLLTAIFIGQAIGASIWGPLSDRWGRRPSFMASLALEGVFGIGAAMCRGYWVLLAVLFCVGTGVGGNLPISGSLFAESVPPSSRGRLMVFLSIFFPLGGLTVAVVAWSTIPHLSVGWRLVVGSLGALNLASAALGCRIRETPTFLVTQGRGAEAQTVLQHMAAQSGRAWERQLIVEEKPETEKGDTSWSVGPALVAMKEKLQKLLRRPVMPRTMLLLSVIWFFSNLGYGLFNSVMPALLKQKNIPQAAVYRDAVIYAAAGVPGTLVSAWLVETRLGRRGTTCLCSALLAASLATFNLASSKTGAAVLSALVNGCASPMYAAFYLYTPEVIPTAARGTGVAWLSVLSRISGLIAPPAAGLLLEGDHNTLLVTLSVVFMLLVAIAAALLPLETRGRALA